MAEDHDHMKANERNRLGIGINAELYQCKEGQGKEGQERGEQMDLRAKA